MTMTEKILAQNSARDIVKPGEIIEVAVDKAMIHDNNAALVIKNFERIYSPEVWDPDKVVFFIDHHSPSTTAKASKHHDSMRKFAKKHSIKDFYDCGCGISHVVMLEDGHAQTGKVVVGTDSHTTGEGAMGSFATGIGATEMAAVLVSGKIWLKVPQTIRINADGPYPEGTTPRDLINLILGKFGPDGASYCAVEFGGDAFRRMDIDGRIMSCVMRMEM
ncbi:MAG: aconitase family protein, partial [Prolixibacteraceae bacterium]|nr:aconitase family protein [Prolixibacteraceae bacterium]